MAIHAFKLENDNLELDVKEILKYDLLARIYKRDPSKNKDMAYKEFKYIYLLADSKGYIFKAGLSNTAARKYAKQHAGLNDSYKPDKDVESAVAFIREHLEIHTVESLINSTLRGLSMTGIVVEMVVSTFEDIIEKSETSKDDIALIEDGITKLLTKAATIPSTIKRLTELKEEWDSIEKGTEQIRGGIEYSTSFDGDDGEISTSDSRVQSLD